MMSGKELRRVHVIRQAMEKQITQGKAGELLRLTDRQIRRLLRRVEPAGDQGLVHRGRGKPSNRRISEKRKGKVLKLYEERYGDFGPTLAVEKLAERHGLSVSDETLRGWLHAQGVTHFRRRTRPHRAWRARKAHVGELVQLDGSHHDWLEGPGLCRWRRPNHGSTPTTRSRPNQTIRGASGGGRNEDNTRRRPEHKPDISKLG